MRWQRSDGRGGSPNCLSSAVEANSIESPGETSTLVLGVLCFVALASRIVAVYLLPNAEQDGYSYAEIIAGLTTKFESGQFHPSDLYGFWLPLFQVAAAVLNIWLHQPIVAGKIINLGCGAVSVVLVFAITRRITASLPASILAFGLILLNPLHLLYSAACMTDVPHVCVVLASLWYAMRRRWLIAAGFGALGECLRVESWALIVALPVIQLICERRISRNMLGILISPLVGWLLIAWVATGDPLAYFHERSRYHAEYLQFHPERHGFDWHVIAGDSKYFLLGAGRTIFAGSTLAAGIAAIRWIQSRKPIDCSLLAPMVFSFSMLGLIFLAYFTKAQPVLLPRYGLVFFALGLPLFAWALQWVLELAKSRVLNAAIVIAVVGGCLIDAHHQWPTLGKVRDDFRAHQQIAAALVTSLKELSPGARCFSDDVAVRVLSDLPPERLLRSAVVPPVATANGDGFLSWLRSQNAAYLVFFPTEDSLPAKFFPELARTGEISGGKFELLRFAHSSFGPSVWLYRVR
ncbi:MAG TPA: hypothetical protein VGM62_07190 [Chthoniobacterales bacterium]|jgi:hypothetical protein